jgi:hypothetical protein
MCIILRSTGPSLTVRGLRRVVLGGVVFEVARQAFQFVSVRRPEW